MRDTKKRFEEKFHVTPGCWIWIASTRNGYGRFRIGSIKVTASRYSYEIYVGTIPEDFDVLHRCDNPSCVNPDHLFVGTHDENMQDMINKGRHTQNKRRGEGNAKAKLTEQQVIAIRQDTRSQCAIARHYSVGQALIWKIKNRILWRHV
jgi:hypothetical protein